MVPHIYLLKKISDVDGDKKQFDGSFLFIVSDVNMNRPSLFYAPCPPLFQFVDPA
jgi:hypothetical protein